MTNFVDRLKMRRDQRPQNSLPLIPRLCIRHDGVSLSKSSIPEHERLFDEICGKLNELSFKTDIRSEIKTESVGARMESNLDKNSDRYEKLQTQLRRTQEDWKQAQEQIQERMKSFETFSLAQGEMSHEIRRMSEMLEAERQNNVRMSADLAKALELNLKLQFDIEESRAKAGQMVNEERKHNSFLVEKNKSLNNELELAQALNQDIREELSKAREKYQLDQSQWSIEKSTGSSKSQEQVEKIESLELRVDELENFCRLKDNSISEKENQIKTLKEEALTLTETVEGFELHANQQNDMIRKLSGAAEQKMVELKLALDKKAIESNDYYSHLQQALTQIQVLKQENSALKEYIAKISALHQAKS